MEKNIKKIFNSLKHRVSVDFNTEDMPQHYHFIDNFDNTTEEECIKLDNKNKDIYKHNIDLYKNVNASKLEVQLINYYSNRKRK